MVKTMSTASVEHARRTVDEVYRAESRRVFATLIRLLGDFDLAEEALHEAFAAAVEQWPPLVVQRRKYLEPLRVRMEGRGII